MRAKTLSHLPVAAMLAATLGLAACDRKPQDATVGQQIDSAVTKAEQKTDVALAKVEQKTEQVIDAASAKLKDASITTSINAELASDPALSALKINVDTNAGRVALKGSAPDSAARDRASQLARKVDGVVDVDNQLEIRSN